MARTFPVIDADGHVIERDRELREFLPDPTGGAQGKRRYALFPWDGWARGGLSPHRREHPDPTRWISFLDACGITATVLYPSDGLSLVCCTTRTGPWPSPGLITIGCIIIFSA
jgi:hypothetical protein